jgi:Flp pilus assembly protein TadD
LLSRRSRRSRKDTVVIIHPLTDDRRRLPIEKRGTVVDAPPEFMLVVSYNPGYQSILKDLKQSTRQRFVAMEFDYPEPPKPKPKSSPAKAELICDGAKIWSQSGKRCAICAVTDSKKAFRPAFDLRRANDRQRHRADQRGGSRARLADHRRPRIAAQHSRNRDDDYLTPGNVAERQITGYRHSVATKQALLQFLSFAYQLNGNSAQAEKYHDAVYALQGPLWGLSWKLFVPRFYRLFDDRVKGEKGENFGRYQYLAATLLADAGDEFNLVFDVLLSAQKNAPTDGDIAGLLANSFLQKKNPKEAERLAKISLQLKPDQKAVLIDLATAQWLLNDFDNSIKHAEAAAVLDPQAPGPRLTLALNFIEKMNFPRALKESAAAASLSRRHPFYLTVQAAAFEAAGNSIEAEKLLSEAWRQKLPSYEDLDKWYVNEKLRRLVLKIAERLGAPKTGT